jgi:ABC-type multidrug transport system fused ATPase/permease subunit
MYVATIALNSLATWGTLILSVVGQRVLFDVRTRLFRHLETLSLSYFDKESIGRIISRLTSDVSALNEVLTQGLVGTFADLVMVIGLVVVMLSMSVQLSLLTFAMLPLMVLAGRWFTVASRTAYRRVRLAIAEVNAALAEGIVGIRVVQAFRREAINAEQFDEVNTSYLASNRYAIQVSSTIMPALDVFNASGAALMLWFGGRAILGESIFGARPELTIGILTAFVLYVERFFEPIRELTAAMTPSRRRRPRERIFQLPILSPRSATSRVRSRSSGRGHVG